MSELIEGANIQSQQDELMAMESILGGEIFKIHESTLPSGQILIENPLPEEYLISNKEDSALVKHLPPLVLHFTLPKLYPSTEPPRFTLSATWLGLADLSKLCRNMDSIWKENTGMEVLFLWSTFLKEETLPFLNYLEKYEFKDKDFLPVNNNSARKKYKPSNKDKGCVDKELDVNTIVSSAAITIATTSGLSSSPSPTPTPTDTPIATDIDNTSSSLKDGTQSFCSTSKCSKSGASQAEDSSPQKTAKSHSKVNKRTRKLSGSGLGSSSSNGIDRRAVSEISSILQSKGTLLLYLIDFSDEREELEFNRNVHTCTVCFSDKLGTEFVRLRCGHAFCTGCVSSCYITHIKEGNVDGVKCLGVKCSEIPTFSKVKAVVGAELLERYDSILLQRALENMNDLTYCPRSLCGKPVLLDVSGDKLTSCSACGYRFCCACKMVYHGVEPCRFKADERKKLFDRYTSGSHLEKKQLEKTYGKVQLKQLVETTLSEKWVQKQSKPCPHCKAPIDKFEGCNKVTCGKCNSYFCWKCLTLLDRSNPYFHYNDPNSTCFDDLFENNESDEEEDEDFDIEDEEEEDSLFDSDESDYDWYNKLA